MSKLEAIDGTDKAGNVPFNKQKQRKTHVKNKQKKSSRSLVTLGIFAMTSSGAEGSWLEPNKIWREIPKTDGGDRKCMS